MANALYQRERNFQAVKRIVGVLVILAVLCGGVLLVADEAGAQTLEGETPSTDPVPGDTAPEIATTEPATTEPAASTDATSDPAPETQPPTTDPAPAPEPVVESAPEPDPVLAVEPTPVIESAPAPEPTPEPVAQEPVPEITPEPAPAPAPEIAPDPVAVVDPAPAPEPVIVSEPPPVLDPIPMAEPTTDSVPSPTTSEEIPVPGPEPAGLDPTISESGVPPAPTESVPASAPAATLDPAPTTAAPVSRIPAASNEPDTTSASERQPLAAPAFLSVPSRETPGGPPEGGGRMLGTDATLATPVKAAADIPGNGFGETRAFGQDGNEVANLPQSLASRLIETASDMFGSYSGTAARLTRQADRMATVLLQAATHLIEKLADDQDNPVPAKPTQNTPSPAVPPTPVPVPAAGGVSCSSSGGSWECQNDAHYALLIGALAGAFALGIPKGSNRFFHEVFKPNSILPQVAERPG